MWTNHPCDKSVLARKCEVPIFLTVLSDFDILSIVVMSDVVNSVGKGSAAILWHGSD